MNERNHLMTQTKTTLPLPSTEHLARHYLGEIANVSRIEGRANTSRRHIEAAVQAMKVAADDTELLNLAKSVRLLAERHDHDTERVQAQQDRFTAIRVSYSQLDTSQQRLFWALCNEIGDAPVPKHYMDSRVSL